MNRSSRHEQKHRLRSVLSQDNSKEGTAARTRPFSFDEIMLRRKSKKLSEEAENVSLKDSDKTSDHSIPGNGHRNSDDILPVIKHLQINKEKGQALVEFLTPEDATASLYFDGRSFSGSILKIRRPKDFIEMATGVPDKSAAAVDTISDIVRDSPQKIFIGGISKAISAEMLMEIVSAFGPLKAYHFEINLDLNESCDFLEYADQSVTLKACAGLNGMTMGGQMLTVILATPDASLAENIGNSPFYGIPEHAKPLLQKPTHVLMLKNVLDAEGLSSLSEVELEELLEDTRFECARYGTVKSVKVVKHSDCHHRNQETGNFLENPSSARDGQDLKCKDNTMKTETSKEHVDCDSEEFSRSETPNNAKEAAEVDKAVEDKLTYNRVEYVSCDPATIDKVAVEKPTSEDNSIVLEEPTCDVNNNAISLELPEGFMSNDQMECCDDKVDDDTNQTRDAEMETKLVEEEKLKSPEANEQLQEALAEMNFSERIDLGILEKGENGEWVFAFEDVFEPGSVLVEFRRIEAACMAAHCLHGRLFDNRMVMVGYVDYNIYKSRFPK
ncbi:Splicing factor U2AF like [Actinidia chinensis var. chinensis]|uniref:Splicing factor U2AF like n=1 Tax=Actinidia chinensis var. chinensis TaxID=1590841 RepID=A0A2R6PW32_ACTCC|nr:Splicing factor U2AF like [Actinidia chinensis var. chinensis]